MERLNQGVFIKRLNHSNLVADAAFFPTTFHGFVALFPTSFRCSTAFFGTNPPICYVFMGDENVAK